MGQGKFGGFARFRFFTAGKVLKIPVALYPAPLALFTRRRYWYSVLTESPEILALTAVCA